MSLGNSTCATLWSNGTLMHLSIQEYLHCRGIGQRLHATAQAQEGCQQLQVVDHLALHSTTVCVQNNHAESELGSFLSAFCRPG